MSSLRRLSEEALQRSGLRQLCCQIPGLRRASFDRAAWQQGPATWLVMYRDIGSDLEPPEMGEMYGARYRLTSRFPASPLSGLDWFLYREDPSAPAPEAAPDAPPDPLR